MENIVKSESVSTVHFWLIIIKEILWRRSVLEGAQVHAAVLAVARIHKSIDKRRLF
jgi:hypothetical protein